MGSVWSPAAGGLQAKNGPHIPRYTAADLEEKHRRLYARKEGPPAPRSPTAFGQGDGGPAGRGQLLPRQRHGGSSSPDICSAKEFDSPLDPSMHMHREC